MLSIQHQVALQRIEIYLWVQQLESTQLNRYVSKFSKVNLEISAENS